MRYWLGKLLGAVVVLLAVSAVTFAAVNLLGDPLFNVLGPVADDTSPESQALISAAIEQYHLDDPLPLRWLRWVGDLVRGDLGVQFGEDGQPPVRRLVLDRLPRTAVLVVLAQVMAVVIAVPWAVAAASRARRPFDHVSTGLALLLVATPAFALGVLLKYVLAIRFDVFPQAYEAGGPVSLRLGALVLPALTLALPTAAVYQRLVRAELVDALQHDFVTFARAKGVSRRGVLCRHALPMALVSPITVFGQTTGGLIGGALVVESIFLVPGLGLAIVEAILREDFPVVLAVVMVTACSFVIINLLVDVVQSLLDPRIRR